MGFSEYKKQFEAVCNAKRDANAFSTLSDDCITNSITYTDVLRLCRSFEAVVNRYGLKSGDRITVAAYSPIQGILHVFAALYWNITVVLPDITLTGDIVQADIVRCESRLILSDRAFYQDKLKSIDITVLDIESESYDVLFDSGKCIDYPDRFDDVCFIVFSSGTGGYSNPVMITYDSVLTSNRINLIYSKLREKDTLLQAFPYYHIGGLAVTYIYFFNCSCIYIPQKYDVSKTVQYLKLCNPTAFAMIPKVFEYMIMRMESTIKEKGRFVWSYYNAIGKISEFFIRHFGVYSIGKVLFKPFYSKIFGNKLYALITGGTISPDYLAMKIRCMGLVWYNSYSSTETNCPMVVSRRDDEYGRSSTGRLDWDDEVKVIIADKDENEIGEVRVKTPMIMKGYFHNDELTKAAFDDNGYFKTGDLGYADEKGYIYLQGRLRERIHLINGEKTSPDMLEQLFHEGCPDDNPVIICKRPSADGIYDEVIAVFHDLSYSEEDKKEIREKFYREVNGRYPIKSVEFVKNIPVTAMRKVKRSLLSEMISGANEISQNDIELGDSQRENPTASAFDYFIGLAGEYVDSKVVLKDETRLSETGLDSLALFSISTQIHEKFGLDIIPMLSDGMTIGDLRDAISAFKTGSTDVHLRKIKKSEIKEMALMYAELMADYPLYKEFYPDEKLRQHQLKYNAWHVLYSQMDYTYVNEDKTALVSVKNPGDRNKCIIGLYLNPEYTFGSMRWFSVKCLKNINSYLKFEKQIRDKYYNPKTDVYVENVCISKDKRSSGLFFGIIRELGDGRKAYFETHSLSNLELYLKMGAVLHEESRWEGITYYSLTTEYTTKFHSLEG